MSPVVLAVLLLSAGMHTAWNGWMKGSGNKLAYHWVGLVAAIAIYAVPVALTTPLAAASTVGVTNPLTSNAAGLTVTKTVTGAPATGAPSAPRTCIS